MPKVARLLSALEVSNLKIGTHAIGGVKGLYLRKTHSNAYYFLRYCDDSGRHDYTLGNQSALSLKEARQKASEALCKLAQGLSPIEERQNIKAEKEARKKAIEALKNPPFTSFEEMALEWVKERALADYWVNNPKGEKETVSILRRHIFPDLGSKDIDKITPEEVRDCLAKIWQTFPSTASKAKTYLFKVFQWSIAMKRCHQVVNPADIRGSLGILLEPYQKNRKESENHSACSIQEIPRLISEIRAYHSISARAVEFGILTGARTKAILRSQWHEFDFDKKVWTIPIENDKVKKKGRDRRIFLSDQAIALLKSLPRIKPDVYVFPSQSGSYMSDNALVMFLRGLHEKRLEEDGIGWIDPIKSKEKGKPCHITMHGTSRASFRTWAKNDELGNNRRFDQEAVELCLLHEKQDGYNQAYDRARLEKERRFIMEEWGKYCYSETMKKH